MGAFFICEKHGGTSGPTVCEHIYHELESGNNPELRQVNASGRLLLCRTCYDQHHMDQFEGVNIYALWEKCFPGEQPEDIAMAETISKQYDRAIQGIKQYFYCPHCLNELTGNTK